MILRGKTYDILKVIAQIWLPALGVFYATLTPLWHLPAMAAVTGTILAVDTLLGGVLQLSSNAYKNSDEKYDGEFIVEHNDGAQNLRLKSIDYTALNTKNELVFKLTDHGPTDDVAVA